MYEQVTLEVTIHFIFDIHNINPNTLFSRQHNERTT